MIVDWQCKWQSQLTLWVTLDYLSNTNWGLGTALSRAIFAIREKKDLAEGVIHYEDFQELLTGELKLEANLVDMVSVD